MKIKIFLTIVATTVALVSTGQITNDSTKADFISPRLKILKSEYAETKILLDSAVNRTTRKSMADPNHVSRVFIEKDGYFDQKKAELKKIYDYIQDTANYNENIMEIKILDLLEIQKKINDVEVAINDPMTKSFPVNF